MILYWIILILINIPVYLMLGKLIFDGWDDFFEAVVYFIKPDWWSISDGEWLEDKWATLKLTGFAFLCSTVVYGEHATMGTRILVWLNTGTK